MELESIGELLPLSLLLASLDCSLLALPFLLAFFLIQHKTLWNGIYYRLKKGILVLLQVYSFIAFFAEGLTAVSWYLKGENWGWASNWFLSLLGLDRLNPWHSPFYMLCILCSHLFVVIAVTCSIKSCHYYSNILDFSWGGFQFRAILRSILLPSVQLLTAATRPCWISLPFFVCSCVGLFHWSVTGNFVGLSWAWGHLLFLTGLELLLLYIYQLPLSFPPGLVKAMNYLGLYQLSTGEYGWLEIIQSISLLVFYILLSVSIYDVEETDEYSTCFKDVLPRTNSGPMLALSSRQQEESPLIERLLGRSESFCKMDAKLCSSWTKTLPNSKLLQLISINFFVYGFPACLLVLSLWSFKYASISAFVILIYVGVVLYSFPSVLTLWRINTALLLFILFWAICTYMFNAVFTVLHDELEKDTEVWNTIGFWHYPVPGFFLLAQFVLGIILGASMYFINVALRNMSLVDNAKSGTNFEEEVHDKKIFILAVLTWFIHRSSHTISLILLFLAGVKHGVIGSIYMLLFLMFLLRPKMATRARKKLIVICEIHVGILYMLNLNLVSDKVSQQSQWFRTTLSVLGLLDATSLPNFLLISTLLVFSALQLHGFRLLISLATVVEKSQLPPFGFEILRSSSGGPVLVSVCASHTLDYFYHEGNLTVKWIMDRLSDIGDAIHGVYRSLGTVMSAVTVLLVVYKLGPSYISLGYLILLLYWMTGRQLIGQTKTPLWAPLFAYALLLFLIQYVITCFPELQKGVTEFIYSYPELGFKSGSSFFYHLWDSLLILVMMQLFRYERAQKLEGHLNYGDHIHACYGFLALLKRLVILHADKILAISVFYASMSPISAIGFIYLILLVASCMAPKSSQIPSKVFSVLTTVVTILEFVYQILGTKFQLFPGQVHGSFAYWIGFRVFSDGFWGLESGLRSRVLVFSSCILQYSAFSWLKQLPASLQNDGKYDEPCCLFVPYPPQKRNSVLDTSETKPLLEESSSHHECGLAEVQSDPSLSHESGKIQLIRRSQSLQGSISSSTDTADPSPIPPSPKASVMKNKPNAALSSPSMKQTRQWSKKAMLALRKERYEAQIRTLRVYAKHLAENFFNLFGVEICMLVFLFASFAVLNVISLVYMMVLSLCLLLSRRGLGLVWPYLVTLFGSILLAEYIFFGKGPPPWEVSHLVLEHNTRCHVCWKSFQVDILYCNKCWLGITVDDWQTLIAYFLVFFVACLKLKSDIRAGITKVLTFEEIVFFSTDKLAWKEINYETRGQWTWLDRLRFYTYRRFLDIVLLLVFITGTFQYDILHLGYLAFALVFFRMRSKILKKRNRIFCYLRLYNFTLIILSLLYQAPYFGNSATDGKSVYDMIGFVKIAYGLDIKTQSILIDITIFCVGYLQSCIFSSKEFEQVLRYLEAEEMDEKLKSQEAKAAWKTEQLQRIRNMEEIKQQRRLQVEKMKSEVLNVQLDDVSLSPHNEGQSSSQENCGDSSKNTEFPYELLYPLSGSQESCSDSTFNKFPDKGNRSNVDENCRRRNVRHVHIPTTDEAFSGKNASIETRVTYEGIQPKNVEIVEEDVCAAKEETPPDVQRKGSLDSISMRSGVQIIGQSVAQVQSLGNKALENLAGFLNIQHSDSDDTEGSSIEVEGELKGPAYAAECITPNKATEIDQSNIQKQASKEMCYRLSVLYLFCYSKIRSNIDVVCYFLFFLAYVWEFSLLMLVYPASLFIYALLVNPGPSQTFWLCMLIYTEVNILLQYMNQVIIHHTDYSATTSSNVKLWLQRAGIPTSVMSDSFVGSVTPLFLVYLSTLIQCSIKARDGEWMSVLYRRQKTRRPTSNGLGMKFLLVYAFALKEIVMGVFRSFFRYCLALIYGSEAPPHFVQVTMRVTKWPEDGIQPSRIESEFNELLKAVHYKFCESEMQNTNHSVSNIRVESIESSPQQEDVVIAVLEVIYVAPRYVCPSSHQWTSLTPAKDVAWEIQKAKDEGLVEETSFPFPIISVIAGGKREVDFYAYIFGCDLAAFFFVAIGYQSFIKNSPEFLNVYQLEDQFPKDFVFVLMTLFFLIVVDRVIYLWSFAVGKLLYYICSLGLFGYYATHYDWKMSAKEHGLLLLRIFCLIKGLSLSLQALQIKYGLPHKTALYEQFLTRKVSHLNYIGFRIYRSLPFLFELRCILDWSCSTTSLTMYDWLKLEDIHASLYLVKCDAKLSRQKHKLGEKRGTWSKFFSGICTFLVLICIIWAPMLMYSSGNPTNFANPILDVHMRIDVNSGSGKFSLYQTSLCEIFSMDELVASGIDLDPHLIDYELRDIQLICCEADADNLWLVPPPTLQRLTNLILDESSIISKWEFTRQRPKTKEVALYTNLTTGYSLSQDSNDTIAGIRIPELHPQYFRVTSTGDVRMLEGMTKMVSGNLTLNQGSESWWTFLRDNASNVHGCGNLDGPFAITVSEETPQGLIGDTLSKFSITSLYITFVLAVGRFIRLQCADLRMRIPYENLPSCDRLIAICEDIYAARAAGELILEEGLFWTLIRIYRSPTTLLEYTKLD